MSIIKPSVIKEIAKEIMIGNTCYIHRYTSKITKVDQSIEGPGEKASQEKIIAELERKIEDYVKIEKLNTQDQLSIMKDFLEDIPDKSVRKQISNALNRENPVRNFNQAMESDMELNQHWRNFKSEEYQRWVSNFIIEAYNY